MDADEEEENPENENFEPQINSNNPTERIIARRLRIQRRVEALRKQKEAQQRKDNEESTLESEDVKTPIETQVGRSMELLENLLLEGDEYVTNVRVATEAREADRREREGIGKEKLLKQLEEEAIAATTMFNEINERWSSILKYNDPLHIHDDIASQKEKCDELIRQKDGVIADLRAKLRSAEIHFGIDQRKQIEDVNSVTKRIEHQIIAMRRAFREELHMIEDVILAERQLLIEANNKKWDDLYKKRDQEEKSNAEKRTEDYWNFVQDMDNLNRDFQELCRETTIKLESDCDMLQREMERIKVETLMNSEKLAYNYQILKKREDENLIIKTQQKRRINKLQDIINSLRKKNNDYAKQTQTQIEKLTEELSKLTQGILDIEKKADHMAEVNDIKFQKIWDMNKQRIDDLFNRILEIDKILYEQQLGLVWEKPYFVIPAKPDFKLLYEQRLKTDAVSAKTSRVDVRKKSIEPKESDEENEYNPFYTKTLKHVLSLIADETGFLIEDQLTKILQPYMEQDKTLIKMDNVFSALNISDKRDIDFMLDFFFPYMHCPICNVVSEKPTKIDDESLTNIQETDPSHFIDLETTDEKSKAKVPDTLKEKLKEISGMDNNDSKGSLIEFGPLQITIYNTELKGECIGPDATAEDDRRKRSATQEVADIEAKEKVQCQYHHPLFISSVYVLTALKEFLGKYHKAKPSMPSMSARLTYKRSTASRMANSSHIKIYWQKYREIFPKEKEQLWDSLLEGLKKYHELLKARRLTCEEVSSLRQQNTDLRKIFVNYIDINDVPFDL